MAKILAPNKSYNGISASVVFVNGIGETDKPELINWFKEHGYTVEDDKQKDSQLEGNADHKELEDMTKAELEEVAKVYEVEYNSRVTKEELVKLIKEKAGYVVKGE